MAPRRGGGGVRISIGSTECVAPFAEDNVYAVPLPYFISFCIFFLVALGTLIATIKVKKAHPHAKRLLGFIYGTALFWFVLSYALLIVATMLRNCGTTELYSYYNWTLTTGIFFRLATFFLLVLVFWVVNSELAKIAGKPAIVNVISAVVLGIMFCLTAGYIGVASYNTWTATPSGQNSDADPIYKPAAQLQVAYWVMYILSIVGAAVLQIVNIASIRSKGIQTGSLSAWVGFTMFSMFIWALFYLIEGCFYLSEHIMDLNTSEGFEYVEDFFQAASFIGLLGIAKSAVFAASAVPAAAPQMLNNPAYPQQYAPVPQQYPQVPQQQYAYNHGGAPQPYYYQQQPVYNNVPAPVNGQGQYVQAK